MLMKSRRTKWFLAAIAFPCLLYALLFIPDSPPPVPQAGNNQPFAWSRDQYWSLLEARFREARSLGCEQLSTQISAGFSDMENLLARLRSETLEAEAPEFGRIEDRFFDLGVFLAACPKRLPEYITTFGRLRTAVKDQSRRWDMNSEAARDALYQILYGGRAALEEVMLQSPREELPEVAREDDEPSVTPSAAILGVTIHSGDILVSRGGAPTSALIARGNDYPGNFSHIALVHVAENGGVVSIIESHIEKGVAVADVDTYLRDTKLRIMVLRLRSDLPCMQADPLLPHKAAAYALGRAKTEHISYDFAMDSQDSAELFCSEVVSEAYGRFGVRLWAGLSHMSSPGIKAWLSAFGVRNFTTQEPSDLEYDPQLRVVAEWRDYETLYKDRLDNAVVDIMLEAADRGAPLDYDRPLLPWARIVKAYSLAKNIIGAVGPIPEGMSATAALRNRWFTRRHQEVKERLSILADEFRRANGYSPPYWELIKLARQAYSP